MASNAGAPARPSLAIAHLQLRLGPVNRALRAAVEHRAAVSAGLDRPDLTALCVTDRQAAVLLDHVDALGAGPEEPAADLRDDAAEGELRAAAGAAGVRLPLDDIAGHYGLSHAELDALLLVATAEIDPAYERLFGYVLDDLARQAPCVDLLATVGAAGPADRLLRRRWLGPAGTLRRSGLLVERDRAPTDARQELALAPGLFDVLLGVPADLDSVAADPGRPKSGPVVAGLEVDSGRLAWAAAGLASGEVHVLAVWGARHPGDLAAEVARLTGRAVRRLPTGYLHGPPERVTALLRAQLRIAAATGAVLWADLAEPDGPEATAAHDVLGDELAASSVPVLLTGEQPWRAPALLARRPCLELDPAPPTHAERVAMWASVAPQAGAGDLDRLAARFRLCGQDLAAAASLARTEAAAANGNRLPLAVGLERAAATVSQRRATRLAATVRPDRSPDELILPPAEFRQVLEVASFFEAWPRVAERWGFAGRAGGRGLKALFTGEPGTGKTLAAEVIASRLGLSLVTTDLSRIVSKWVGETEKNLDAAFAEAEACNAVLFFDEADALFGRRGQVDHGTDRWANLEVGYLLQRLESFDGLAILASNLRENIDPAFTRRFGVVVHFPRPTRDVRLRLWRHAFPGPAPLADVDVEGLAGLDLTGAGIVQAARTAALLAAQEGATAITMAHVVRGVSRQFQREARLLRAVDLGRHAALLEGAYA